MIMERNHIYKEGDFTYKGGYLYICILTNLSQCWALYCLIFFYYATKNELSPIRPVGKFLSVKALVFFTWWQSVCISILYQMDLIPHYHSSGTGGGTKAMLSQQEALALDDHGGQGLSMASTAAAAAAGAAVEWTPEDVAKGLQDYLICIEMFVAAIVHSFVFPHTEYSPQAVEARSRAMNQTPHKHWNKRLGRKWKDWDNKSGWSNTTGSSDLETYPLTMNTSSAMMMTTTTTPTPNQDFFSIPPSNSINSNDEDDLMDHPLDAMTAVSTDADDLIPVERRRLFLDPVQSAGSDEEQDDLSSDVLDDVEGVDDGDEDEDEDDTSVESNDSALGREDEMEMVALTRPSASKTTSTKKPNFVRAFLDSTIPQDLRDNTVGIIKGDYVVEKKTLLHHAVTSDSYDLFSRFQYQHRKKTPLTPPPQEDVI